jgi:nucleoside-diphosphate-sugar epimerase
MRVLVAGGSGAIGRRLVPLLVDRGDEVVVLSRSKKNTAPVVEAGARVVTADALDADRMRTAVNAVQPDAIVDLLTALPRAIDPRRIDRDTAATNELRTVGTENVIAAAREAGVQRIVSESIAFIYDPGAGRVNTETAALWKRPPRRFTAAVDAVRVHEKLVTDAGGTILRFGLLYGPGTEFAPQGGIADQVRKGRFPIVGGGSAVFSFTHVDDAATAIDAALRADVGGTVLNVVDDEPAEIREWLPYYAQTLGARAPGKVPAFVARLLVGSYGVAFNTKMRGASNARAKELLDWVPEHRSWRDGFTADLKDRDRPPVAA